MQSSFTMKAPFGSILLKQSNGQPCVVILSNQKTEDSHHSLPVPDKIQQISQLLERYFENKNTIFTLDFDRVTSQTGTAFQKKVWQAICQIPVGKTSSYSEIARNIGSGPRAVANACGANQLPILVPCHRVVAKNGLGGFMQGADGGLAIKKWLLKHEGITCE